MARGGTNTATVIKKPDMDEAEAQRIAEIEAAPMQAELKYLDHKWTDKGQSYFIETVDEERPEQVNWWQQYALCLTRHMDQQNRFVQRTTLQINSQHLKDILLEVIESYPGISFATKELSFDLPCRCLYHYRHELAEKLSTLTGDCLLYTSDAADE